MKAKVIYAKAFLMIFLMIALPIYASKAYAESNLVVKEYSGDAGVEGFFDERDRWLLEVDASIDGDSVISNTQLRINNIPFQSCNPSSPGMTTCRYDGEYYFVGGGVYLSVFTLISDAGDVLETVSKTMTVDNLAPLVEFTRSPIQNGQEISVAFEIKDVAFNNKNFQICSGIQKIEFLDGSNVIDQVVPDTDGCIYSGEITLPLPSSERVIVKAYDNMGHSTARGSPAFNVDNDAPVILTESFQLLHNQVPIGEYIPGEEFSADMTIRINDPAVVASKTKVDLTGLGGDVNVAADKCSPVSSNRYVCEWNDIPVNLVATKTVNIVFDVEDSFGNVAQAVVARTFNVDSISPVITSIGTDYEYEGVSYIGPVPTDVTVTLTETGAGMNGNQVFLDLSGIDSSLGGNVQASECVQDGTLWTCKWFNVYTRKAHGTSGKIYVILAADDTGNLAMGPTQASIKVDRNPPVVFIPKMQAFSEIGTPEGLVASNDELVIEVSGTEESGVRAFGDFSKIYDANGADELEGGCIKLGGNVSIQGLPNSFECVWDIPSVVSGYVNTVVPLTFVDSAGNEGYTALPVEILIKEGGETNPDYWSVSSLEIMPKEIDRQTIPIIRQRVYAAVNLVSSSGASTAEIKLKGCSGDGGYAEDIRIFSNQRGSSTPYIYIGLKTLDANKLDKLKINCELEIISVYGKQLSNLEIENVTIEIPFYNNPLGEASEKLNNKIKDLKETYVDGWWSIISGINKFVKYAQLICNVLAAIKQITVVFGAIKDGLAGFETATAGTPVAPMSYASRLKACLSAEAQKKQSDELYIFGDKICKFINCQLTMDTTGKWTGWMGKWQNMGTSVLNNMGGDTLKDWTGKDPNSYMNPKESFAVALLTACIPGILHGLDKYRQIQCQYIVCLQDSVKTGLPEDACDKLKSYETCKYFVGEIFQIIPFTAIFDFYMTKIKNALSSPFSIIGVALGAYCISACPVPQGNAKHSFCWWVKVISVLGEIIAQIEGIIDGDTWSIGDQDYCKDVDDLPGEEKEEEGGGLFG